MLQNVYLCIGNGRKGSISRMSDECLMKQETVFSFYVVYQAVMRKFTLAGKTKVCNCLTLSMLRTFVQRLFQQGLTVPTFSTIYSNVIFTSCLPLRIRHRTIGLCLYACRLKDSPVKTQLLFVISFGAILRPTKIHFLIVIFNEL